MMLKVGVILTLVSINITTGFFHNPSTSICRKLSNNVVNKGLPISSSKILKSIPFTSSLQLTATSSSSLDVSKESKLYQPFNKTVLRVSWISWWTQIILSVISGVILTFANTVRQAGSNGVTLSLWASGFAFSAVGVILAFLNAFSTWNITRLVRRIRRGKIIENKIIEAYRKYFRMSVTLSFIGTLITLIGAEQIVGTLASKVLSNQGLQSVLGGINPQNVLQAVDIFLVQANTNTIVSHFAPLLSYVWLLDQLRTETLPTEIVQPSAQNQTQSSES